MPYTVSQDKWPYFKARIIESGLPSPLSAIHDDASGTVTVTFEPPLSPAIDATVLRYIKAGDANISVSKYAAIESDIATLRSFIPNQSPTNAQSVAAIKSIIRVLATLIND